jgi:hypothetical protein
VLNYAERLHQEAPACWRRSSRLTGVPAEATFLAAWMTYDSARRCRAMVNRGQNPGVSQ